MRISSTTLICSLGVANALTLPEEIEKRELNSNIVNAIEGAISNGLSLASAGNGAFVTAAAQGAQGLAGQLASHLPQSAGLLLNVGAAQLIGGATKAASDFDGALFLVLQEFASAVEGLVFKKNDKRDVPENVLATATGVVQAQEFSIPSYNTPSIPVATAGIL